MSRILQQPFEILNGGGTALSCGPDGAIHAESLQGLFAGDTRVLSTYRIALAGHAWHILSRTRSGPSTAQWDMQNPTIMTPGGELPEGTLHLRLRRRLSGALHDDLTLTSFIDRPVSLRLSFQLDADFADIFQVKDGSMPPRLGVQRVPGRNGIRFAYERNGFRREMIVSFRPSMGTAMPAGAHVAFDLVLEPRQPWHCCMEGVPGLDGAQIGFLGDPHALEASPAGPQGISIAAAPILSGPFERGCSDLDRLAIRNGGGNGCGISGGKPFLAAGAPWFMTLFGRDTLVTSLMSGVLGPRYGEGALAALASTQARESDDLRDAQPGKIAHELRQGELARFHAIPHTPYYGTHDAPALFVLALWNLFRWTGDRLILKEHLPAAEAALRWCEMDGDEDGDGLLEYRTRSRKGYRNQGWKDAGDAIPHQNGIHAESPIATVELQGYWYAARMAMAELLETEGRNEEAGKWRAAADRLRLAVEEKFWMEEADCYALALDGSKNQVRSIASNQGHLLWCGLPSRDHGLRVARRLLAPDMYTGYGVRTLSADHCRYNPLSYQLGSVWPHDNALFAAGLARYGLRKESAQVFKGILEAASCFEQDRLPELFCGLDRDEGPPVPYEKANIPQAWAAAVPLLAGQVFLGLMPDAPKGICSLSPWLPEWLPVLELRGIEVGNGRLSVRVAKHGSETRIEEATHPGLKIVEGAPPAALWGPRPFVG
jgi:glycogen debranching enzyme